MVAVTLHANDLITIVATSLAGLATLEGILDRLDDCTDIVDLTCDGVSTCARLLLSCYCSSHDRAFSCPDGANRL